MACIALNFGGQLCGRAISPGSFFCVLHRLPRPGALARYDSQFHDEFRQYAQAALDRDGILDCTGFRFPLFRWPRGLPCPQHGAVFKEARFFGPADFHATNFGGRASFEGATFYEGTTFRGSTFGSTQFRFATFLDIADFEGCTFGAPVTFAETEFYEGVSFAWAEFKSWGLFDDLKFGGAFKFSYVRALEDMSFNRLEFHGGAEFNDFRARRALFSHITLGRDRALKLQTAQIEALVLETVDLHGWLLVPLFGLRHFTRSNVQLPERRSLIWSREVLFEEYFQHELEQQNRDSRPDEDDENTPGEQDNENDDTASGVVRPELLEAQYRELKNVALEAHDNQGAALFHYAERDTLRRRTPRWSQRILLEAYRASCGYGERPWRAAFVNLLGVVLFAFIYLFGPGLLDSDTGPPVRYLFRLNLGASGRFAADLGRALLHSSENWIPLGFSSGVSNLETTGFGKGVELCERLIGAPAVGLFILAFGRQLRR